jgi:hypothetical protein
VKRISTTPQTQSLSLRPLLATAGWVLSICFSSAAIAAPTVKDHLQSVARADYQASMIIWSDGAIGGFLAANSHLTQIRNETPLFCLPKGQGINSKEAMKLIDQGVGSRQWEDWVPLSTVLLDSLQKSYPCNQRKK